MSQRTRAFLVIAVGVIATPFFLVQFFSDPEATDGWEILALFLLAFFGIVGGIRMLRADQASRNGGSSSAASSSSST